MAQDILTVREGLQSYKNSVWYQDQLERDFAVRTFLFLLAHVPLAYLFRWNSIFPTMHALGVLVVGVIWIFQDRFPTRVVYLLAYITGAELLWRGTGAGVIYEYGKYASVFLMLLALIKYNLISKAVKWPAFYFGLLLPSVFALSIFDRQALSFNLSGPLALAMAVIFFSQLKLSARQVQRALVAIVGPVISLGVLIVLGILQSDVIYFADESNFLTSASIGPNQVSSILGLATLALFILILLRRFKIWLQVLLFLTAIWLLAQMMLTFSRGGFWATVAALAVFGFYLFPQKRARLAVVSMAAVVFSIMNFLVFPVLDEFTGNALLSRFQSFEATGRYQILQGDLLAFRDNWLFGIGPGQSRFYHALTFRESNAHTEYSRMLAEHGLFGLVSLLIFVVQIGKRFFQKGDPWQKSLALSLTVWGLAFMLHAAMRLTAPAYLIGLASARLFSGDSQEDGSFIPAQPASGVGYHK